MNEAKQDWNRGGAPMLSPRGNPALLDPIFKPDDPTLVAARPKIPTFKATFLKSPLAVPKTTLPNSLTIGHDLEATPIFYILLYPKLLTNLGY